MTYKGKGLSGIAVLVLCVIMTIGLFPSFEASADDTNHKIVRVGWYESPFCYRDDNGRRYGYAYDYRQKIAGYVDWEAKMIPLPC